jgi:GxxExxY protein
MDGMDIHTRDVSDHSARRLTHQIIGAFYRVYNVMGYGFLESVYCEALALEFGKRGVPFIREAAIRVSFEGCPVGSFRADFVARGCVVVEVKAGRELSDPHRAQLLNCLRASNLELGLLLNFGPRPIFERFAFSNARKAGASPLAAD